MRRSQQHLNSCRRILGPFCLPLPVVYRSSKILIHDPKASSTSRRTSEIATDYTLDSGNACTGSFHNAEPEIPISPKLPRAFDPATLPNVGSSCRSPSVSICAWTSSVSSQILQFVLSVGSSTMQWSSPSLEQSPQSKYGGVPKTQPTKTYQ